MEWLTAILAFATTMLIFSVIVTTLVETAHRSYGARARGLWNMLERFYEQVIEFYHAKAGVAATPKAEFLQKMTENRVDTAKENTPPLMNVNGTYLNHLPVEIFMERLASTEFPKVFAADYSVEADVLKDVAQKFENFGLDATLKFQQWARVLSLGFSLFVAAIFYVHPHVLISTYIENPKISEKIALKSDEAVDNYKKLEAEIAEFESKNFIAPIDTQSRTDIQAAITELKAEIDRARENVGKLSNEGIPLGWPAEFEKKDWSERFYQLPVTDWLWLLFGALLIGLGAPFWSQFVTSLVKIRDVGKSVKSILAPEQASAITAMVSTPTAVVVAGDAATQPMQSTAFTVATAMREKPENGYQGD